jgi:hypothetical protein
MRGGERGERGGGRVVRGHLTVAFKRAAELVTRGWRGALCAQRSKASRVVADPPAWPSYEVGPYDSVFALGVASVNYARLEFAFSGVFAKVLELPISQAWELLAKINNNERLRRMKNALQELNWPDDTKVRVTHFVEAFKILADNRNLLDHSIIFSDPEGPTSLYKSDRKGKTIHAQVTVAELRQVADDMMRYFNYGLLLGKLIGPTGALVTLFSSTWPDQPPSPLRLDYTNQPLALRRG